MKKEIDSRNIWNGIRWNIFFSTWKGNATHSKWYKSIAIDGYIKHKIVDEKNCIEEKKIHQLFGYRCLIYFFYSILFYSIYYTDKHDISHKWRKYSLEIILDSIFFVFTTYIVKTIYWLILLSKKTRTKNKYVYFILILESKCTHPKFEYKIFICRKCKTSKLKR